MTERLDWSYVLSEAARIVDSYDTSVTLRQLFYRLVAAEIIPNTTTTYKTLSRRTAEARRNGNFPALYDRTRQIHRHPFWDGADDALRALRKQYRRDRTEFQPVAVYLAVEKHGLVNQLDAWFGDLGIPILSLGGYTSQSYVSDIARRFDWERRYRHRYPALLYAGDFDPSGEDIQRDFIARVEEAAGQGWHDVRHVALTAEQVEEYRLPPQPGKATDSRADGFMARHGDLVQVELDALDPNDLRELYQTAIADYWDDDIYRAVRMMENEDLEQLTSDDDEAGGGIIQGEAAEAMVAALQAHRERFRKALEKVKAED